MHGLFQSRANQPKCLHTHESALQKVLHPMSLQVLMQHNESLTARHSTAKFSTIRLSTAATMQGVKKVPEEKSRRRNRRTITHVYTQNFCLLFLVYVLRLSGRGHFNSRDLGRRSRIRLRSRAMN